MLIYRFRQWRIGAKLWSETDAGLSESLVSAITRNFRSGYDDTLVSGIYSSAKNPNHNSKNNCACIDTFAQHLANT